MDSQQLLEWVTRFSHPAVFGLLVLCGVGAPLSEDVIALTAGLVAAQGQIPLWTMIATVWAGTLTGDFLLYRIGRSLGPRAVTHRTVGKVLTPERVARAQAFFASRGAWAVALARFMPGFRAPTFLVAGMSRFELKRFLLADGLAAVVTASVLTSLGHAFGMAVLDQVRSAFRWVIVVVCVVGGIALGLRAWRARRRLVNPS